MKLYRESIGHDRRLPTSIRAGVTSKRMHAILSFLVPLHPVCSNHLAVVIVAFIYTIHEQVTIAARRFVFASTIVSCTGIVYHRIEPFTKPGMLPIIPGIPILETAPPPPFA